MHISQVYLQELRKWDKMIAAWENEYDRLRNKFDNTKTNLKDAEKKVSRDEMLKKEYDRLADIKSKHRQLGQKERAEDIQKKMSKIVKEREKTRHAKGQLEGLRNNYKKYNKKLNDAESTLKKIKLRSQRRYEKKHGQSTQTTIDMKRLQRRGSTDPIDKSVSPDPTNKRAPGKTGEGWGDGIYGPKRDEHIPRTKQASFQRRLNRYKKVKDVKGKVKRGTVKTGKGIGGAALAAGLGYAAYKGGKKAYKKYKDRKSVSESYIEEAVSNAGKRRYLGQGKGGGEYKLNSPSLLYWILYDKQKWIPGRSPDAKEKPYKGMLVDEMIPERSLDALNAMNEFEIRSVCQGHGKDRPMGIVLRFKDINDETLTRKFVDYMNQYSDIKAGYDVGSEGRYRVGITTKMWYEPRNESKFMRWWMSLPMKIKRQISIAKKEVE